MISAFLLNFTGVIAGFKPFTRPIVMGIFTILTLFMIIFYQRKSQCFEFTFELGLSDLKCLILFSFLPFITILGTFLMNKHHSNILILVTLILIALVPLLLNKIPNTLYGPVLFFVSLSLILHTSLISDGLWGSDVQGEYFIAKDILDSKEWSPSTRYNIEAITRYNSLLSVGVLPVIYALLLDIGLTSVYKVIYPLILSFSCLGVYMLYTEHFNKKLSFLSTFYLISFSTFFLVSLEAPRQIVGTIFFVLILNLTLSKKRQFSRELSQKEKILLLILFIGLIVSHYGVSYVILFLLAVYLVLFWVLERISLSFVTKKKFCNYKLLNPSFLLFAVVFALAWYIYTSNSITFDIFIKIISQVSDSIRELGDPFGTSLATNLANRPIYIDISNFLRSVTFFLIPFGLYSAISKRDLRADYTLLSFVFLLFFGATILIPYLAPSMGLLRINIILMVILAPLSIRGLMFFFENVFRVFKSQRSQYSYSIRAFCVLLTIITILNTGVPHEFYQKGHDEYGGSFSINERFDYSLFKVSDVEASEWILNHSNESCIYGDNYRRLLFLRFDHEAKPIRKNEGIPNNSYIFLNWWNLREGVYSVQIPIKSVWLTEYESVNHFATYNKIYDCGNANVLHS